MSKEIKIVSGLIEVPSDMTEEQWKTLNDNLDKEIFQINLHYKLTKLHSEVSKYFDIEPGYEVKEFDTCVGLKHHYVAYQVVGEKKGYCVNITFMTERQDGYKDEFDYEHMLGDLLNLADKNKS